MNKKIECKTALVKRFQKEKKKAYATKKTQVYPPCIPPKNRVDVKGLKKKCRAASLWNMTET